MIVCYLAGAGMARRVSVIFYSSAGGRPSDVVTGPELPIRAGGTNAEITVDSCRVKCRLAGPLNEMLNFQHEAFH